MADGRCSDVVRVAGDLGLAPEQEQPALAAHLANCRDCASYVSQITTTRELLGRQRCHDGIHSELTDATIPAAEESARADTDALRRALLTRAQLLDPPNAEDLTQRSLEVGLALQRSDHRARGLAELTRIMHTLSDARARLDARTTPAVDASAADRARADWLEDLDSDADEPELFYPELYPGDNALEGWVDSPNQWRGGAQILGPEEVDETGEVYDVLDQALGELPEPLGELLVLVDLRGYELPDAAQALGLDTHSAAAALARARNHVRGRLDDYLTGVESAVQIAQR